MRNDDKQVVVFVRADRHGLLTAQRRMSARHGVAVAHDQDDLVEVLLAHAQREALRVDLLASDVVDLDRQLQEVGEGFTVSRVRSVSVE